MSVPWFTSVTLGSLYTFVNCLRNFMKGCRTILLRWFVSSFSIWDKWYNLWRFFLVHHSTCSLDAKTQVHHLNQITSINPCHLILWTDAYLLGNLPASKYFQLGTSLQSRGYNFTFQWGDVGSIPASRPKNQNIKQKWYCNKFNKDFKQWSPLKKKNLKKHYF